MGNEIKRWLIDKIPTNWLIRLISHFTPELEGNPDEWLERDYPMGGINWREFRCGSVRGIYRPTFFKTFSGIKNEIEILAVQNTKKNNHFDKTLEWFKKSAERDHLRVSFLEVGNPKLAKKLSGLGFVGTKQKMSKDF